MCVCVYVFLCTGLCGLAGFDELASVFAAQVANLRQDGSFYHGGTNVRTFAQHMPYHHTRTRSCLFKVQLN